MKSLCSQLFVLALLCMVTNTSMAHHSFGMFDINQEMWIEGTVKELQWNNPHVWIQVLVPGENDGEVVEWSLEGGSPNILSRNGWNRTVLQAGDKVRVLIYPLKNGKPGGSFLEVHKTDGSVYYYHG